MLFEITSQALLEMKTYFLSIKRMPMAMICIIGPDPGRLMWLDKRGFCLDFEVLMHYIMLRRGGLYDQSRYHLRSF